MPGGGSSTRTLLLATAISIVLLLLSAGARAQEPLFPLCSDLEGNYTTDSTYRANLDVLLASLSSTTNTTAAAGFSTYITGEVPDRIYGLALCRGDAQPADCGDCLRAAASGIVQVCPSMKSGMVWYDTCFLRYSNRRFLNTTDSVQRVYLWNNATQPGAASQFNASLLVALQGLAEYAARSESAFAAGEMALGTNVDFPKLYWLVQCTRDIPPIDCRSCLRGIIGDLPNCCSGKIGGRVLAPSCNFRYEVQRFYNWSAALSLPPPSTTPSSLPPLPAPHQPSIPPSGTNNIKNTTEAIGSGTKKSKKAIAISLSVVFGTMILLLCALVTWRIMLNRRGNSSQDNIDPAKLDTENNQSYEGSHLNLNKQTHNLDMTTFEYEVIFRATDYFSDERKLGQGGFGYVYKGTLPGGQEIAVKRLSGTSSQGSIEFKNEVALISRLQHRNLVQLLGCCTKEDEKLLIYEFMPNKSLNHFLFDASKGEFLDWPRRFHIIQGIAHGLLYLHRDSRLRIIHRDLKASNILLDSSMNPKISDFGIARIVGDQSIDKTSRVVGTLGYMSPEYAMQGEFSEKSDIFSFGVLLLEVVSGKRVSSFYYEEEGLNLLGYAWKLWNEDKIRELIEPLLLHNPHTYYQITKCVNIGLLCVQEFPKDRPNMSIVTSMLTSDATSLPNPKEPAIIGYRDSTTTEHLSNYHESTSTNDVTITELFCR